MYFCNFFIISQCKKVWPFRNFIIISFWKRAKPIIWTNLNPIHPRMLCGKFGWNWSSGFGEDDISNSSMYFRYFIIISPWKRVGPFIWTNLNPLHPRMLCAKFGWNWLSDFGEEDFLISFMYFHYFVIISHRKKRGPSFDSQKFVDIGSVVLERKKM